MTRDVNSLLLIPLTLLPQVTGGSGVQWRRLFQSHISGFSSLFKMPEQTFPKKELHLRPYCGLPLCLHHASVSNYMHRMGQAQEVKCSLKNAGNTSLLCRPVVKIQALVG